jgi:hypothetical protein
MLESGRSYSYGTVLPLLAVAVLACLTTQPARTLAQTTISTGSILGTVSDQTGAVVPGARVTITNKANGQSRSLVTTGSGTYESGPLQPGEYTVRVEAKGFQTYELPVTVQVGVTSTGDVRLSVGQETTVVEVEASAVQVNTSQATIQDVITADQIRALPINGRNFLDLAQLEPGVQIQDGANFDPTKNGFSSISFSGRFGRTARIEVDGLDISDETVGTTTQNIPASGIQEFQAESSSLDLTTELTSSGAVNVSTKSGTNDVHGEAFGFGRWHNTAARIAPEDVFSRRQQFGGNVGGPIKKDKLFFFMDWERTRQDLADPVLLGDPFTSLSGGLNSPFKEHEAMGRLDWVVTPTVRAFYRFTYNIHSDQVPFIPNTYQPFFNRDHTQDHAAGVDFNTGLFMHSIRFGFLRFANEIDVVTDHSLINPAPNLELAIGADPFCLAAGADAFCSGPNFLAPQATLQTNLQFKYDGSKVTGPHVLRYGIAVNRILGGGFAGFLKEAPAVGSPLTSDTEAKAAAGPFPGGASNPLNYPANSIILGNGQGFSTAIPGFGYPGSGEFDTRFSWYFGDTWKAKPNLAINLGIRYVRDTGRDDANLPPVPILNEFGPGLGRRTNQPNKNFAPQVGIAWDPAKNGKTVIRAGAGLFYENAVFNNVLFDAPARLQKGLFLGFLPVSGSSITLPTGQVVSTAGILGAPIGTVANQIAALETQYAAATIAAGPQSNGSYIGNALTDNYFFSTNLISPDYRTPYSLQFNVGVERQIRPGTVLSVDYARNTAKHLLLYYDTNHVGAARNLNTAAAINAINITNQAFGCPVGTAGINCAIAAGAHITDYAGNRLDSGYALYGGSPASASGLTPSTGAAFPGINPNLGANQMLFPIGSSDYNALLVSLKQNVRNPLPHVKAMNLTASYSLSRFNSQARDQDFINAATDFDNINHYVGPNGLDRTHQFSFGGVADLPYALRVSLVSHIYTALPVTLFLPATGAPGEIFRTDITGDGTEGGAVNASEGDVLPGTNIGSFGRSVTAGTINTVINNYNTKYASQLTPAGQALVSAGLFTTDQLKALGAVTPTVAAAPSGQVGPAGLFTADLRLAWELKPGRSHESFVIEPNIACFNLFNSANYDGPAQPLNGVLSGTVGSANGTTYGQRTNRITLGSGVYALGAPRVFEWGMRITF